MEEPLTITTLNDFIFCPASIYYHNLDYETEKLTYQDHYQLNGTAAHEKVDNRQYSDRKDVLQGISVYCEQYGLTGKIDVFDVSKGLLTERKRTIRAIYDGYVFQLYAQYFCLVEMGYRVSKIRLYSMTDNKVYTVNKPEEDPEMLSKFLETLRQIRSFNLDGFKQSNTEKCRNCIYEPLCSFSLR